MTEKFKDDLKEGDLKTLNNICEECNKEDQSVNEKLCKVRTIFDRYNLISAIHALMAQIDKSYSNILPPLSILDKKDCQKLIEDLEKIDFNYKNSKVT